MFIIPQQNEDDSNTGSLKYALLAISFFNWPITPTTIIVIAVVVIQISISYGFQGLWI